MEIDMAKQRKNKSGFVFENKIDFTNWDFTSIEHQLEDAIRAFEDSMEKAVEKSTEALRRKIDRADMRARKIVAEALQISFERELTTYFWDVYGEPEILTIYLSDLCEDGYEIKLDLKAAIKQALINRCDKDGYAYEESEPAIIKFADMLKELENEVRTAIRPKEEA
jgi:hypothetical protein